MDKLLFHCADGSGILSSLLQLRVHALAVETVAEDRAAVVQLRGHSDEFAGVACDAKTTDKGDATQGVQGSGEWEVSVNETGCVISGLTIWFVIY